MAPVLRQKLALFETDITFLGEALYGVDIAVIYLRAFGLSFYPRLAILRNTNSVATGHGNITGATYLKTVRKAHWQDALSAVLAHDFNRFAFCPHNGHSLALLKAALSIYSPTCPGHGFVEINNHTRLVITGIALLGISPSRRAARLELAFFSDDTLLF